jgi:hypothetical protein
MHNAKQVKTMSDSGYRGKHCRWDFQNNEKTIDRNWMKALLICITTGCIKKKETFRNQAYCKNLNAFSIAHMLNRGA